MLPYNKQKYDLFLCPDIHASTINTIFLMKLHLAALKTRTVGANPMTVAQQAEHQCGTSEPVDHTCQTRGPRRHEINMMPFLIKGKGKIIPVLLFLKVIFSATESAHSSMLRSRQRRGELSRCFTTCTRVSSLAGLFAIIFFTRARSAGDGAWLIVADNSLFPPSTTEEIITICTCWGSPINVGPSSPRVWVIILNIL